MLKAGSSKMGAHLLWPVIPSTDLHSKVPRAAFSGTLPVRTTSVWAVPDSSPGWVTPPQLDDPSGRVAKLRPHPRVSAPGAEPESQTHPGAWRVSPPLDSNRFRHASPLSCWQPRNGRDLLGRGV